MLLGAAQAEVVYSGTIDGGAWEVDENGVMTITGAVDTDDLEVNGTDLQDHITKVVIGPNTKFIQFGEFSYSYSLTEFVVDPGCQAYASLDGIVYDKAMTTAICCPTMKTGDVTLPATVTTIGGSAFVDTRLNSLILPDGLTAIGDSAFWASNLEELRLPASVESIDANAFCVNSMTRFVVDSQNEHFSAVDGVLFSKDGKTLYVYPGNKGNTYSVPAGTEEIEAQAFYSSGLTSLTLPEGLLTISAAALAYNNFTEITLPASLTTISNSAFDGCKKLATVNYAGTTAQWAGVDIHISNDVLLTKTIHCQDGDVAPQPISGSIGVDDETVSYTLTPDGMLTISGAGEWESYVFSENITIVKATLESGVTEVGHGAFFNAANLREVVIPDTVTEIKWDAFYGCSSLTQITIPASVTAIGEEAFCASDGLRNIYYGGTIAQWQAMADDYVIYNSDVVTVHCSDGDIPAGGGEYNEDERGECGDDATYFVHQNEGENMPAIFIEGTGALWDEHFMNRDDVDAAIIRSGIQAIGSYTFANMPALKHVELPETLTSIGDYAFAGDTAIEMVVFYGSPSQWEALEIGEGNGLLLDEEHLIILGKDPQPEPKWLCLPADLTAIEEYAFAGSGAENVVIPQSCDSVGAAAFQGCQKLHYVEFANDNTVIGAGAFADCPNVVFLTAEGSAVESYALQNGIDVEYIGE